jgi:hypothetical protein
VEKSEMNERTERIIQGSLLFIGTMMIFMGYYQVLPFKIASLICVGCFVAIGVLHYYA